MSLRKAARMKASPPQRADDADIEHKTRQRISHAARPRSQFQNNLNVRSPIEPIPHILHTQVFLHRPSIVVQTKPLRQRQRALSPSRTPAYIRSSPHQRTRPWTLPMSSWRRRWRPSLEIARATDVPQVVYIVRCSRGYVRACSAARREGRRKKPGIAIR